MRRVARWSLLGLAATGIAAPAWAEHEATRRIDQAVGVQDRTGQSGGSIDIDLGGLSIHGAALRGSRVHGSARLVRVEPRLDGLHVRVEGLQAELARTPSEGRQPAAALSASAAGPRSGGLPKLLRGIPLHVSVEGSVSMDGPKGLRARAVDPELEIDAAGEVDIRARAELIRGERVIASAEQVRARAPQLSIGSAFGAPQWAVSARVRLASGAAMPVAGFVDRDGARLNAGAGTGAGSMHARLEWGEQKRVRVRADRMRLDFLSPTADLIPALGLDLSQAELDGELELVLASSPDESPAVVAELEAVRLRGLVLESAALAKDPLYMREIGIDGRVQAGPDQLEGALSITHAELASLWSGHVSRDGVDVELVMEPIPCQSLLDSMPAGFVPTLEGMQLRGEIQATASTRFSFAALADPVEDRVEGQVELDFPFLDQCQVTRDAPGIDLAALAGSYRHRFLTGGGREKSRVLSAGAEGFVTIASAPELARAFVILEDARFWTHDGFDREQIERAFWHNLGAEGFSRGASTITQQTARNLWLGHDRSLSRKLQEAVLTARLERELDKRRILEIYMNIIELGPEVHGVAEAAQYHFDRAPHELNTIEALHLASLAPAPVAFSRRFASGEVDARWRDHLMTQVERLRVHRLLSSAAAQAALRMPLRLIPH